MLSFSQPFTYILPYTNKYILLHTMYSSTTKMLLLRLIMFFFFCYYSYYYLHTIDIERLFTALFFARTSLNYCCCCYHHRRRLTKPLMQMWCVFKLLCCFCVLFFQMGFFSFPIRYLANIINVHNKTHSGISALSIQVIWSLHFAILLTEKTSRNFAESSKQFFAWIPNNFGCHIFIF